MTGSLPRIYTYMRILASFRIQKLDLVATEVYELLDSPENDNHDILVVEGRRAKAGRGRETDSY
jgi:translation elongation factor EF-Tu-like GTPase